MQTDKQGRMKILHDSLQSFLAFLAKTKERQPLGPSRRASWLAPQRCCVKTGRLLDLRRFESTGVSLPGQLRLR